MWRAPYASKAVQSTKPRNSLNDCWAMYKAHSPMLPFNLTTVCLLLAFPYVCRSYGNIIYQ
ncbi:MAG TPA: hypothetical protein DCL43_10960 [Chitinophagaceae bacterium]|nr:hypothetical protein [Chitinophagaceae bacterium]HAN39855.1 hypothetical protein [Chitinophagaceae bacterium]